MPKVIFANVDNLGLAAAMFGKQQTEYKPFVDSVITEQAGLLKVRVGSSKYDSSQEDLLTAITRAELCLTAAELLQRRKNYALASTQANGREFSTTALDDQIKAYRTEAESLISKVASTSISEGADFSSGALVTDHF